MKYPSQFRFKGLLQSLYSLMSPATQVHVNNHLVVDLGGVHNPMSQAVLLDAAAGATYNGMVLHQEYPRDIFAAERHMIGTLCKLYQVTIPLYTLCPPCI